jgi:hypothetical protein
LLRRFGEDELGKARRSGANGLGARLALAAVLVAGAGMLAPSALASSPLSWSQPLAILPSSVAGLVVRVAVSCPSSSLCVVTNGHGQVATSTDPTGGAWQVADVDGTNAIGALACPSVSLCVAGDADGNVVTSTNPTGGAGAWQPADVDGKQIFQAMSCPSVSLCVGLDSGDAVTSARPTDGSDAWDVTKLDTSTPPSVDFSQGGLACPTVTLCVAGGTLFASGGVNGDGIETTTAPLNGAGAWSITDPGVHGATQVKSVSCPSASLCVMLDDEGNVLTATNPGGGASAWTEAAAVGLNAYGLSCPTATLCVGVNGGAALTSTNPTGGAGAWSVTQNIDEQGNLESVSCPSVSLCVAADAEGDVVIGTPAAAAVPATVAIKSLVVHRARHTAKLAFDADGPATAFQCALVRGTMRTSAHWVSCQSPVTYRKLERGKTYTVFVRAVAAQGGDGPVAHRTFKA